MDGDKRNVTEVPMTHRETEGTEINTILRRCRRHKERRRYSVQILDNNFEVNAMFLS